MLSLRAERSPLRLFVAALVALLIVADLVIDHPTSEKVLGAILLLVLGEVTVTDLESRRIPNAVVGPASVVAVVVGLIADPSGVPAQAFAGVATGAFLLIFAVLARGGLGMGDVKLGVVLGLFLGRMVVLALVAGLVLSAVFSIGVLFRYGIAEGRKVAIPMGPFLAVGGAVAVLAGHAVTGHWGGL